MLANHAGAFADAINFDPSFAMMFGQGPHKASDKRRAQNRAAQKTYREKKKRRLEELENLAASAGLLDSPSAGAERNTSSESSDEISDAVISAAPVDKDVANQVGLALPLLETPSMCEPDLQPFSFVPSSASAVDDGPLSNQSSSTTLLPEAFDDDLIWSSSSTANAMSLVPVSHSSMEKFMSPSTSSNGSYLTPSTPGSSDALSLPEDLQLSFGMRPSTSRLRFEIVPLYTAFMQNVRHTGMAIPEVCIGDENSEFFRPQYLGASDEGALVRQTKADYRHIKPDLRPTEIQILVQHPAWVDMLPFPELRERLISMLCQNPPLLDEEEFCKDVEQGVMCWSSAAWDGNGNRIAVSPWDGRSWEAKTWFLNKWNWLITDESSLARHSEWWRSMRESQQGAAIMF